METIESMMTQEVGQVIGLAYVIAMILISIGAVMFKKHVRLIGGGSWMMYILLGPWPLIVSLFVTALMGLPPDASLPPTAVAIVLATISVHFVLPAVLPDFHTENVNTSVILGTFVGLALMASGHATRYFVEVVPSSQSDMFGHSADIGLDEPSPYE